MQMSKLLPHTLYHYCNCEAFQGIISSKTLRLSNVFESNDYLERKHIDTTVEDQIDRLALEYPREHVIKFKKITIQHYKSNRIEPAYCIAFSEAADLLSQWRGYADDGRGFAIGFAPIYFNLDQMVPFPNTAPDKAIGIFDIIYETSTITKRIREVLRLSWEHYKKDMYADNSTAMLNCARELILLASCTKNIGFSEEIEWRIMYTPLISYNGEVSTGKFPEIKFCLKNPGLISSYFELPFIEEKNITPINEVIIGPKNITNNNTVVHFLSKNGFDCTKIRIRPSDLSYR